jgi:hypothetical protein
LKVQKVKREIKLREWAEQVKACEKSGLSVSKWCEENGVSKSGYYYRQRRVQEELLDALESAKTYQLPPAGDFAESRHLSQLEPPVFVPVPMPQNKGAAAVTVWLGNYAVDIQNGADDAVVEQVLRVVSRI